MQHKFVEDLDKGIKENKNLKNVVKYLIEMLD